MRQFYVGILAITIITTMICTEQTHDYQAMLFKGVKETNLSKVEFALKNGANVNVQYGPMKQTVLHIALEDFCKINNEWSKLFDKKSEQYDLDAALKFVVISTICGGFAHYSLFQKKIEACVTKKDYIVNESGFAIGVAIPILFHLWFAMEGLRRAFGAIYTVKLMRASSLWKNQRVKTRMEIIKYLINNSPIDPTICDKRGDSSFSIVQKEYHGKLHDYSFLLKHIILMLEVKVERPKEQ